MASSTTTQARSLVARLLGGDLTTVTYTAERHNLRFTARVLPLRHTPVTAVANVTIDGETIDPDAYTVTPFALVREDGEDWPAGTIYVTYSTGWTEGSEAQEVQDALLLAKEWLDTHPSTGINTFSAGSEMAVRGLELSKLGLDAIRDLIAKWRRP